jgi:hypothetical protein
VPGETSSPSVVASSAAEPTKVLVGRETIGCCAVEDEVGDDAARERDSVVLAEEGVETEDETEGKLGDGVRWLGRGEDAQDEEDEGWVAFSCWCWCRRRAR